jgi:aldose 1-epimerase
LPVNDTGIPIGQIGSCPGVELGKAITLGKFEPNVDHCFVVDCDASSIPLDTRRGALKKLVLMSHPVTKLHLEIFSTEPAFQFYTGQYVDVAAAEDSPAKPPRAGICVEPQRYINAINVPEWRNMVVLKRGETWGARTVYKAWKA